MIIYPNKGNSDHVSTTLQSSSFLIKMFSIFGVIVVLYFIKYSVLTETNDSFFSYKTKDFNTKGIKLLLNLSLGQNGYIYIIIYNIKHITCI